MSNRSPCDQSAVLAVVFRAFPVGARIDRSRSNYSTNRNLCHVAFAVFGLSALSAGMNAQTSRVPPQAVIRQIDHIVIGSDQAEALFRLFSEKLYLPVAWPFRSYGSISSGGVGFGNVNVELARQPGPDSSPMSGLIGVAFDPNALADVLPELEARGLKHDKPAPFFMKDGSAQRLYWTTVGLPTLPGPRMAFLCKYNFDVEEGRAKIERELQGHQGGPLGIESALELVIGVKDIATGVREWGVLLGSPQAGQGAVWRLGSGPAIHLVAAQADQVLLLRAKVTSLDKARAFLKRENLLGLDAEREISLDHSRASGADIRLVQ
jgi:hypothetical protein